MPRENIATAPNGRANRWSVKSTEVLAAHRTLTVDEIERYNAVAFDCNGAGRNLVLPAVGVCAGVYLHVRNTTAATHALTIQDAAAATVVAVPAAKGAIVWCDGVAWQFILGA
ncbi:hypothetical protein OHB44_27980 [Micromonospora sp. NBC_00821]|uniref:hypothetical protein n=1 Tax=Micromonospora sp. NBC_00821 TaxID=2975977 RepID=UPI002ED54B02|nr:hypothetical protein OHB44_27980 [Micromonospora sp. NBC_00821]